MTKNPKYATRGHFQQNVSLLIWVRKLIQPPLRFLFWSQNMIICITHSLSHMGNPAFTLLVSIFDSGISDQFKCHLSNLTNNLELNTLVHKNQSLQWQVPMSSDMITYKLFKAWGQLCENLTLWVEQLYNVHRFPF